MKSPHKTCVLLFLASAAWAGPSMTSGSNTISRGAVNGGGALSSSGSGAGNNQMTGSAAEDVIITTADSGAGAGNNRLRAGWSELQAYPNAVAALYFSSNSVSSGTIQWATPGYDGGLGALQVGTTYFIRVASYTVPDTFALAASANVTISTSGTSPGFLATSALTSLLPNTSYFVQLWTQDADANLSAPFRSTYTTLANPPSPGALEFLSVQTSSAVVAWAAQFPNDVSSMSCEGYTLLASSNNFGALAPAGAPVFSSTTYSVLASTLAVGAAGVPLDLSNTYYFQVGSLNWAGQANYTSLPKLNFQILQSTGLLHLGAIDPAVARSTISTSSMVVTNVGNWPATLMLSASTATVPSSPWTLSTSSGPDQAALLGVWNAGSVGPPDTSFSTYLTTTPRISQTGAGNNYVGTQNGVQLAPGANITLWFRFFLPTTSSTVGPETIQVTSQPVYP